MDSEGSNNEIKMKEFYADDFSDINKQIESGPENQYYELNEVAKAEKNKKKELFI